MEGAAHAAVGGANVAGTQIKTMKHEAHETGSHRDTWVSL